MASAKSTKAAFWYNLYKYMTSKKFRRDKRYLPLDLQRSQVATSLLVFHLARMFDAWLDSATTELFVEENDSPSDSSSAISADEVNSEVTRFVGWAMVEVYKKYTEKLRDVGGHEYDWNQSHEEEDCDEEADDDDGKIASLRRAVTLLHSMRLLHRQALADESYTKNYYAPIDQIHNRGGLFLVAPRYIEFARTLMEKICALVNEETIGRKGNSIIDEAFQSIRKDTVLRALFDDAGVNDTGGSICIETKNDIYLSIIRKAFHAKAGEETGKYNEHYTGRQAGADMTIREEMKAICMKK